MGFDGCGAGFIVLLRVCLGFFGLGVATLS